MDRFTFVIGGHVDHGKSSLIGRLLADTNSLPPSKIEKVKKVCQEKGRDFEYAFLLDALSEEREQNITIDTTKIEFSTPKRHYTIIDAPGHKEFLKNMITGASNAEGAILIIDAAEGIKEQSKRHAFLLSLIGVKQVFVAINKMDLAGYSQQRYEELRTSIEEYLGKVGLKPIHVIPISAKQGDNVAKKSETMAWYKGPTVLDALDDFVKEKSLSDKALRLPVQDVYRFDERRIIAGTIASGKISIGDQILVSPSGHKTSVKTIESWPVGNSSHSLDAGRPVGITVADEIFVKRGEIITHTSQAPSSSDLFVAQLFWMGASPLGAQKPYKLKIHTQEVECHIQTISKVIDATTLEPIAGKASIERGEIGSVIIKTKTPIAFDAHDEIGPTGRFVLVDGYTIAGGGTVDKLPDTLKHREQVETKSTAVVPKASLVSSEERRARLGHRGKVVWITGLPGSGKSRIALALERELFNLGKNAYFLDANTLRLSLSSDLGFSKEARHEQARRLAEVANMFLHSGLIVIVSTVSPYKNDREYAKGIIGEDKFLEVFVDTPQEVCKQSVSTELLAQPGFFDYETSESLVLTIHVPSRDFDVSSATKTLAKHVVKETQ